METPETPMNENMKSMDTDMGIELDPEAVAKVMEPWTERTDEELRQLAADCVDGKVYGDWMVPPVLANPRYNMPNVVHVQHSAKLRTPLELMASARGKVGPEWKADEATLRSMFMVLTFIGQDTLESWCEHEVVHFYEYAEKAEMSMQINSMPIFYSINPLTKREWKKLREYMKTYEDFKAMYLAKQPKTGAERFLPATISFRDIWENPDGTHTLFYQEWPAKSWAEDEYTINTGYRDGVNQNHNISFGARYCTVKATVSGLKDNWKENKDEMLDELMTQVAAQVEAADEPTE